MKTNIELEIEELVLYGFSPADGYRIGEAVERELVRLIAERGFPAPLNADTPIRRLDGGSFRMGKESSREITGAEIARSIHGAFGKK